MGWKKALRSSLIASILLLAWLGGALWGQSDSPDNDADSAIDGPTPSILRKSKQPITAIVDAMIYSMVPGDLPYQGVLLFQGERILGVGERMAIPPGAHVINARGKVLTPGFVIANTRLGLVEISLERSTRNDISRTRSALRPAFRVSYGFNYTSSLLPVARIDGVTSAMVRPFGGIISGLSMVVDLFGLPEQMVVTETLGMHATIINGRAADSWLSLERAFAQARYFLAHQADYNMGTGRRLRLSRPQLMALSRVVRRHIPLILEVHRAADILHAISFAQEQQIRLVLVGVSEGWMVAAQLARSYIPVILQPPYNLPVRFDRIGSRYDNAAILQKAGVLFAFGARGGAHNVRSIRHEAGVACAWGLPKIEALRALTYNFYEIFHLTRHYGSFAKGRIANVVLWSGDPLELSTRALHVWIRGRAVPMSSRQTLLLQRYRTLKQIYRQPRPSLPVRRAALPKRQTTTTPPKPPAMRSIPPYSAPIPQSDSSEYPRE